MGNNQYSVKVATEDPNTDWVRDPLGVWIAKGIDVASVTLDGQDVTTATQLGTIYSKAFDIPVKNIIGEGIEITAKDMFANVISNPGTRTFSILVKNTGREAIDNGKITWRLPTGWTVTGNSSFGTLAKDEIKELNFTFTATKDGSIGMSHVLARAMGQRNGKSFIAFENFPFEVRPFFDASLKPDLSVILMNGESHRYRVTLYNTNVGVTHYNAAPEDQGQPLERYLFHPIQSRSGQVRVEMVNEEASYEITVENEGYFTVAPGSTVTIDFWVKNIAPAQNPAFVMPKVILNGIGEIRLPYTARPVFYSTLPGFEDNDGRGLSSLGKGTVVAPDNKINPNEGALLSSLAPGQNIRMVLSSEAIYNEHRLYDFELKNQTNAVSATISTFSPTNGPGINLLLNQQKTFTAPSSGGTKKMAVIWDMDGGTVTFYSDGKVFASYTSSKPWINEAIFTHSTSGVTNWSNPERAQNGHGPCCPHGKVKISGSGSDVKVYTKLLSTGDLRVIQGLAVKDMSRHH